MLFSRSTHACAQRRKPLPKAKLASWEVSDEFWRRVEPLVPERPGRLRKKKFRRKPGGGRKPKGARTVFEAIVYVLRTGCQWKALPKRSLGSAFHWQPVRSTYTIASNTVRAPFGLRPPPGLRRNFFLRRRPGRSGTSGSTLRQNSSDTSQEASLAFGNGFLRCAHACVERENSITCYLRISPKYPDEAHGKVAEDCKANVADGTTQRRIEADLHGEHEPCNKCDQVGNQLHGHAPAVLNSLAAAQRAQQPSSRGRRRERKHDPPEEPLRPANRLRRQRLEKCRSDFPVQVRGARGYCPGTCVA